MMRALVSIGILLAMTGCSGGDDEPSGSPRPLDPWPEIALPKATDSNADPGVFELDLTAGVAEKSFPGTSQPSPVWAYNGTVPGPLVIANRGDELVAHVQNQLEQPTTIHWHGVRVPAVMDGSPMSSSIEPGGTFDYSFELKDAGLFWFHPHLQSDVQVERGLYGTILVRGEDEPEVDHEAVLVLDDVRVLADGKFPEFLDDESKMMGRHGNVLLVNGIHEPVLPLRRGSLERWRIVNAANGRFFNLALPGHTFRVIGTDGGLMPQPYDTDRVLIAPGERYDIVFIAEGDAGSEIILTNEPYDRGHDSGSDSAMKVASLRFTNQTPLIGRAVPASFPEIERLPSRPIDHTIELDEDIQGTELVFTVNGQAFPNVPMIMIPNGELRAFRVKNMSDMDHPFHLHGFFFQVLSTNDVASSPDRISNKDTLIVPANTTIDLVARFDEPGDWMYHCHILEHAELGMMGEIRVE